MVYSHVLFPHIPPRVLSLLRYLTPIWIIHSGVGSLSQFCVVSSQDTQEHSASLLSACLIMHLCQQVDYRLKYKTWKTNKYIWLLFRRHISSTECLQYSPHSCFVTTYRWWVCKVCRKNQNIFLNLVSFVDQLCKLSSWPLLQWTDVVSFVTLKCVGSKCRSSSFWISCLCLSFAQSVIFQNLTKIFFSPSPASHPPAKKTAPRSHAELLPFHYNKFPLIWSVSLNSFTSPPCCAPSCLCGGCKKQNDWWAELLDAIAPAAVCQGTWMHTCNAGLSFLLTPPRGGVFHLT